MFPSSTLPFQSRILHLCRLGIHNVPLDLKIQEFYEVKERSSDVIHDVNGEHQGYKFACLVSQKLLDSPPSVKLFMKSSICCRGKKTIASFTGLVQKVQLTYASVKYLYEEDDDEEVEEEKVSVPEKVTPKAPSFSQTEYKSKIKQIEWDGGPVGTTCSSEPLYRQAIIRGEVIAVASAVFLDVDDSEEMLPIYFVE